MVILWLSNEDFFIAVDRFAVVLLRMVHVGELEPRLLVCLVQLYKLVKESDSLTVQMHISIKGHKTFRRLFIERVLFHEVNEDVLGFVHFAARLMEHCEQAHHLDGIWELQADHLKEELGPFKLLKLARRKKALFNDVKICQTSKNISQNDPRITKEELSNLMLVVFHSASVALMRR